MVVRDPAVVVTIIKQTRFSSIIIFNWQDDHPADGVYDRRRGMNLLLILHRHDLTIRIAKN
jgi:hypothetical protein